jgi:YD repeat-containing protein
MRAFDSRGNLIAESNDGQPAWTYTFDALNRTRSSTDACGSTTSYHYGQGTGDDVLMETKTLSASDAAVSFYEYDSNHLMTAKVESITSADTVKTTYADFASNGEPQSTTVHDVALGFDANGVQVSPQDLTTTKSYDAFGNLNWEKNALGQWVAKDNDYTVSGRLSSSTSASDAVTHYEYDRLGGVAESWTTDGTTTINHFSQVLDPLGTVLSKTSYDGVGTSTVLAIEACITDPAGRVVRVETGSEEATLSVAHTDYDAAGRAVSSWAPVAPGAVSDDASKASRTEYDAEGQALLEREPQASAATATTYFPSGLPQMV